MDMNSVMMEQQLEMKKSTINKKAALTIQGYQIPKNLLQNEEIDILRKELTFEPIISQSMQGLSRAIPVSTINITDKYIYLPKNYGIKKFGIPPVKRILYQGKQISAKFTKSLRPIQKEAYDTFFKLVNDKKYKDSGIGGMIVLPTGFGKTVLSVCLLCKLGQKTMIVAHKDFLLDQWYDSILKFSDIKASEIGVVKGPKCEIEGKKVVLASLQSLSMKNYPAKTFLDIGAVFYDESHHLGSEVFSQAMPKLSVKYIIGLSATPSRKDGLEKVFYQFMGDIIYQAHLEKDSNVKVGIYVFRTDDKSYYKQEKITDKHFNMSKMINTITMNQQRNQFILNIILKTIQDEPDRKLLVLSERKAQLQYLESCLKGQAVSCGLYYSGISKKILAENLTKRVLLATMQMVSEGFDQPSLNTLFLISPKVQITQIVGRILRVPKDKRTIMPLVVDIFDTVPPFTYYNNSRKNYYIGKGYSISANEKMDLKIKEENENSSSGLNPSKNGGFIEHIDAEEDNLLFNFKMNIKE